MRVFSMKGLEHMTVQTRPTNDCIVYIVHILDKFDINKYLSNKFRPHKWHKNGM